MRAAPEEFQGIYESPVHRPVWSVTSWLEDELLADEVPIVSGVVEHRLSDDDNLLGGLQLTVPNVPEWQPTSSRHPLSNKGQTLRIRKGVRNARGEAVAWFDLGDYLISKTVVSGSVITVDADPMIRIIDLARFAWPITVAPSYTTYQALMRWLIGAVPVEFEAALGDRALGKLGRTYEEDRLAAVYEVAAAWPAVVMMGPAGVVRVRRPFEYDGYTPVLTYRTGQPAGTVVNLTSASDTDFVPNAVVASNAPEDTTTKIYEVAYVTSGPMRWGGPYKYRPAFFSSPLLTTRAQLQNAARTRLTNLQRVEAQLTLELVGDPRAELGDVVQVFSTADRVDALCRVSSTRNGLTPADEPGQLGLEVIQGEIGGIDVSVE